MAIKGDKVTLVTPRLLEIVNELIERYGSKAKIADLCGISRTPLSDLVHGKLTFMHSTIVIKLAKLHGGYTKKDFDWYTRRQLRKEFGITTTPTLKFREIKGVKHRRCLHPEHKGERWIPVSNFYPADNGTPRSWCSACETRQKGAEPYYKVTPLIMTATIECVHRLGKYEAARRCGIAPQTLLRIYNGRALKIRRQTARKILLLRQEIHLSGEIRHKKSINHGSKQRGHPERLVLYNKDYYVPSGDTENSRRQKRRADGLP